MANSFIQSEYRKYGPEKTPYLDTFHAMGVEKGELGTNGLNVFHATDFSLYPLKRSEYHRFSDVFREYRKRPVA